MDTGEKGSVAKLFHEVVKLHPSHIAIKYGDNYISYEDLDRASYRVGNYLNHRLGVLPQPIALLSTDSLEIITNLLGVIRAGHFYSTLSPKDSLSRLRDVLNDLAPSILITDEDSISLAREILPKGCEILTKFDIREFDHNLLPSDPDAKALLGIFYTSGSTGTPKGVIRTHEFILHRVRVDVDDYQIGDSDRLLYMRQFNVSSSLSSIFDALLTGATLVPVDFNTMSMDTLAKVLQDEKITIFPPPIELLRHFLEYLDKKAYFPDIRCVVLGGDVLFRRDVERLWIHLPENSIIVHHLSSSESSLLARTMLKHSTPLDSDIVPLGFPVRGKEILILDQDSGLPLDMGKTGEISVRSEVIFPGYWRQPNQSEKKFRPDPLNSSGRVYCTGDLGYFRPDGQLVFLGRKDFRVKIRGFSVDLMSIESALMANNQVKRAAVNVQVDQTGKKRVVAYVVLKTGSEETQVSIREFVKSKLPEYMTPSIILFLDQLPLTATLKIDRKALPPPEWKALTDQDSYIEPRDEIEKQLASIWQRVLGVEKVGIDEHFFDIGGDSLMVMELILQIAKEFDIHIPAQLLIGHDSIKELSQFIREPILIQQDVIVELSTSGNGIPVFLIPGGNGEIYSMLHLARFLQGKQPIYGLQAAGAGGKHLYKQPVDDIATIFLSHIKKVQPNGPYRLIGGSFGGVVAFGIAQLLFSGNETVALLGMIDTFPPGPRKKAKLKTRIKLHWQRIRTLPITKYPEYFLNWWKIFLLAMARKKIFRKFFSFQKLDSAMKGADVIRAGRAAYALYNPEPYPGKAVIFKAKDRPWYVDWEPTDEWKKYIRGELQVVEVEGTHGLVYKPPYVEGLARAIKNQLGIPPINT